MAVSKKKIATNNKWINNNRDSIMIRLPKGSKELIERSGDTYNGFMVKAFNEYCKNHGYINKTDILTKE